MSNQLAFPVPSRLTVLVQQARSDTEHVLDTEFVRSPSVVSATASLAAAAHEPSAGFFASANTPHLTGRPKLLDHHTYTAHRLLSSTPIQMDRDSAVVAIGPVPEEWASKEPTVRKRRLAALKKTLAKTSPAWQHAFDGVRSKISSSSSSKKDLSGGPGAQRAFVDDINQQLFMDMSDEMSQLHQLEQIQQQLQQEQDEDSSPQLFRTFSNSSALSRASSRNRIRMRRASTFAKLSSDQGLDPVAPVMSSISNNDSEQSVDDLDSSGSAIISLDDQLKTHAQPKPVFVQPLAGLAQQTLKHLAAKPSPATQYLSVIRDRYTADPATHPLSLPSNASLVPSTDSSAAPSFVTARERERDSGSSMYSPDMVHFNRYPSTVSDNSHRLSTASFDSFATASNGLHTTSPSIASTHSIGPLDTPTQQPLPATPTTHPPRLPSPDPLDSASSLSTVRPPKRMLLDEVSRLRYRFEEPEHDQLPTISVNMARFLSKKTPHEAIRLENMLILIKSSVQPPPHDFGEIEAVDTRVVERWKEYIVVCRSTGSESTPVRVQFYQTRTIHLIDSTPASKFDFSITTQTRAKFYSNLDKTVAVWTPSQDPNKPTMIYIFRARTHELSIRLLAFFTKVLGVVPPARTTVTVPDLSLKVDIAIPWRSILQYNLTYAENLKAPEKMTYPELKSTLARAAPVIVFLLAAITQKIVSIEQLRDDFVAMITAQKVGLVWRRYDRLEWVRELTDSSVQTGWVLNNTYDLELRPKAPYPMSVTFEDGTLMEEPTPVEGFLLRLSRWNGKMGKQQHVVHRLFYKKLYFHTHDNFLFFSKPNRAVPPWSEDDNPGLVYETRPYETDGEEEIEWLNSPTADAEEAARRDKLALYEVQRRVSMIVGADGFVDMCEIDEVRRVVRQGTDANLGHSCNVGFNEAESGQVEGFADETVFEIVMSTGVVIRLQAVNQVARDAWVQRLAALARYWRRRVYEDVALLNMVRQTNLGQLHIDEDHEPYVGEANSKWETAAGIAHPAVFHVSRLSWARSVALRGMLYQKANKHATFRRYHVVLTHGYLVLYEAYARDSSGTAKSRADHRRHQALALDSCYVYSGNVAQSELLLRDRWLDMSRPGTHSVPRVYPDGWRSCEEEVSRCFVLWFPTKRLIVDKDGSKEGGDRGSGGPEGTNPEVKMANRLGVPGVSMVFLARSRQERDIWVVALNTEIERLVETSTEDIYVEK